MTQITHTSELKKVERVVEHLFEDWMNERLENLEQYFHKRAVMIEAGTRHRINGIEQIVENYRDFVEDLKIKEYDITNLMVEIFGEIAVAHFGYRMKYRVDNTSFVERNTDILVFRHEGQNWKIVWRTQMIGM